MKRQIAVFSMGFLVCAFISISGLDEVIDALRNGNSAEIAKSFDNTVEITLPAKSNSYSKSQAELILRDFFNNNPVKGFEVIHKGENGGSQYCIGTLDTKNGPFRTTLFMKQKNNKLVLQEIRLENR